MPTYNLFIGNAGSNITSAAVLVGTYLLDVVEANVTEFNIDGNNNVQAFINAPYRTNTSAFFGASWITYFVDLDGSCTQISSNSFWNMVNCRVLHLPAITTAGGYALRRPYFGKADFPNLITQSASTSFAEPQFGLQQVRLPSYTQTTRTWTGATQLRRLYIPLLGNLGSDPLVDSGFLNNIRLGCVIYVHPNAATNGPGGGLNATFAYAQNTREADIRFVQNYVSPSKVRDLKIDHIEDNQARLQFSIPASQNQVDFFEVYVERQDLDEWHQLRVEARYEAKLETEVPDVLLTRLESGTTYKVWVEAWDIYGNKSVASDELIFDTLPSEPNVFLGDSDTEVPDAATMITVFTSLDLAEIETFAIVGTDVHAKIIGAFNNTNTFWQSKPITFFIDEDAWHDNFRFISFRNNALVRPFVALGATSIGSSGGSAIRNNDQVRFYNFPLCTFLGNFSMGDCSNLRYIHLAALTSTNGEVNGVMYNNPNLLRVYVGKVSGFGGATLNSYFDNSNLANLTIYHSVNALTNNGGGLDATLANAQSNGTTLITVEDTTVPNRVNDLSAYQTGPGEITLFYSTPYTPNEIVEHELYIEDLSVTPNTQAAFIQRHEFDSFIPNGTHKITGLANGTYRISLISCDQYWNRSERSNEVEVLVSDSTFNTFIGGLAGTYPTAAALAGILSITSANILNYTIDGSDIKCLINAAYTINSQSIFNNTLITYWYDSQGQCNGVNLRNFSNCDNLEAVYFPNIPQVGWTGSFYSFDGCDNYFADARFPGVTLTHNGAFNNLDTQKLYLPSVTNITPETGVVRQAFNLLRSARHIIIPLATTMTESKYRTDQPFLFGTLAFNCKIYINSAISTTGVPAIELSVGTVLVGETLELNGLVYTAVNGAPADATEFDISSGNGNTIAGEIRDAINADVRVGTIAGNLTAYSTTNRLIIYGDNGAEGNKMTNDISALSGTSYTFSDNNQFHGGGRESWWLFVAKKLRNSNIIVVDDIGSPPSVPQPTNFRIDFIHEKGCRVRWDDPIEPNINGHGGVEVWVREIPPDEDIDRANEYLSLGTFNSGIMIRTLENGRTYAIRLRAFDGHHHYSGFTGEIEFETVEEGTNITLSFLSALLTKLFLFRF